jgi:hypothetical protein
MTAEFESRIRSLMRQSADLITTHEAQNFVRSLAPKKRQPFVHIRGAFMRARPILASAAAVVAITAAFFAVRAGSAPKLPVEVLPNTPTVSPTATPTVDCPMTAPRLKYGVQAAGDFVDFAPSTGLLCEYGPRPYDRSSEGHLVRTAPIDSRYLAELRTVLNALPVAHPEVMDCPSGDGSTYLIILRGLETEKRIQVEKTSCKIVYDEAHARLSTHELDDLLTRLR